MESMAIIQNLKERKRKKKKEHVWSGKKTYKHDTYIKIKIIDRSKNIKGKAHVRNWHAMRLVEEKLVRISEELSSKVAVFDFGLQSANRQKQSKPI